MSALLVGGILPNVVDDKALSEWCHRHLEDGLEAVLFRSGHLSEVVGVQLNSGRQVVIKARPYDPRLMGCLAVQDHLARSGFPCPPPLTGVTRLGVLAVTAETAMPGGTRERCSALCGSPRPPHRLSARPIENTDTRAIAAVDGVGPPRGTAVAGRGR